MLNLIKQDLLRIKQLKLKDTTCSPDKMWWIGMLSPRYSSVLLYRISFSLNALGLKKIGKLISLINYIVNGIEISVECPIGPGLFFPHSQGVVIGAWKIGSNATIFQGVTLGANEISFDYFESNRPTLGNNVIVASGAKVLGGIIVHDNVRIAANAVVIKSVPSGALAVGVPAVYK